MPITLPNKKKWRLEELFMRLDVRVDLFELGRICSWNF
jgi:hypothetical protein